MPTVTPVGKLTVAQQAQLDAAAYARAHPPSDSAPVEVITVGGGVSTTTNAAYKAKQDAYNTQQAATLAMRAAKIAALGPSPTPLKPGQSQAIVWDAAGNPHWGPVQNNLTMGGGRYVRNTGLVDVNQPIPSDHVFSTGAGTFFSPFNGEFGSILTGEVQYDVMTFWLAQKFNPPEVGGWTQHVSDVLWDNVNLTAIPLLGGDFGGRHVKITPELLAACKCSSINQFGALVLEDPQAATALNTRGIQSNLVRQPATAAQIAADIAKNGDPVLSKSPRQCFVERYGWGFLHPGPDVGEILSDIGKITLGSILTVVGVLSGGVISAAGVSLAASGVQNSINDASSHGAKVPDDVNAAAQIFATLQIPPEGTILGGRVPWAGILGAVLLGGGVWYFTKRGL